MSNPIARIRARTLCATLALCGCLVALAVPAALAAGPVYFQHESYQTFLGQLRHSEVHAVEFHTQALKIHADLNNGKHVTLVYPSGAQTQITALAHAHGAAVAVAVAVVSHKPAHHKLRYIAGGVLIVVILVVLVVLLVGRRRGIVELGEDASSSAAPE